MTCRRNDVFQSSASMSCAISAGRRASFLVSLLIMFQIVPAETLRQRFGLTEGKAQAFSGDGINRARCVSDQRYAAAVHSRNLRVTEIAPRSGEVGSRPTQACSDLRKCRQRRVQSKMRIARDQSHADFVLRHRSDIKLAARAPMQFHAVIPRRQAIMPPESESAADCWCKHPGLPISAPANDRRPRPQPSVSGPTGRRAKLLREVSR